MGCLAQGELKIGPGVPKVHHTVAEALPGLKKSSSYATGTDWKDNPLALKKCQEQNPTPRALWEINKYVCLCIYCLGHIRGKITK